MFKELPGYIVVAKSRELAKWTKARVLNTCAWLLLLKSSQWEHLRTRGAIGKLTSTVRTDPSPGPYPGPSTLSPTKPTVHSWPILSAKIRRCREVDRVLVDLARESRDKDYSILTHSLSSIF